MRNVVWLISNSHMSQHGRKGRCTFRGGGYINFYPNIMASLRKSYPIEPEILPDKGAATLPALESPTPGRPGIMLTQSSIENFLFTNDLMQNIQKLLNVISKEKSLCFPPVFCYVFLKKSHKLLKQLFDF